MLEKQIRPVVLLLPLIYLVAAFAIALRADDKSQTKKNNEKSTNFLRLSRDENHKPIALESAIVRYVPKDRSQSAPIVDLVTAVHIGEKDYYEQLNRQFEGYDAVLYELVAPEGTRVPKGGSKSNSMISMVQKAMKDLLELEFQLEIIDYTPANFVHADMSPEQFAASMKKRGETVFSIFFRMMAAGMAQQNSEASSMSDGQLLMALFDKDRAMALKRIMAEQFQSMDGMLTFMEGPDGSTLISERNKQALIVLRKQIANGNKKMAIFYGGGHMPDLDRRLREEFGLEPINTKWLVAWDLQRTTKSNATSTKP